MAENNHMKADRPRSGKAALVWLIIFLFKLHLSVLLL